MKAHDTKIRSLKPNPLAHATAALLVASALAFAPQAGAATFVSVNIAPPALPVYEQPLIPGPGYLWTPGYWAWDGDDNDYYWVPGTWVRPPAVGLLWTPGYWGWGENAYVFHPGYWGPHVGYYGGINYGFGYVGIGYMGGYWRHGGFYYNTAVNRFGPNVHITNVYNRTVVNNVTVNHFSFNGPGGVNRQPTREEMVAEHERHVSPVTAQVRQVDAARHDQSQRASVNRGAPPVMATQRPGELKNAANENAAATQPNARTAKTTATGRENAQANARETAQVNKAGVNARTNSQQRNAQNVERQNAQERENAQSGKERADAQATERQNATERENAQAGVQAHERANVQGQEERANVQARDRGNPNRMAARDRLNADQWAEEHARANEPRVANGRMQENPNLQGQRPPMTTRQQPREPRQPQQQRQPRQGEKAPVDRGSPKDDHHDR